MESLTSASAKFVITDNGKATTVDNVPFKSGMFTAMTKKKFTDPKLKFETKINGNPCVMNFEMPSK